MNPMNQGRKKVLYVITKSNFGGAQRYVYDLATNLPSEQFEPVVAYGSRGLPGDSSGRLATMLQEAGIRSIFIPELGRDVSFAADRASFRALRHIIRVEKPDVLHLNSSKAGGLGALAGRLYRVPRIIFTAHGWPFWEDRNPISRALIFFLSWLTILLSHKTICISNYDLRVARAMPFTSNKTVRIYNGIGAIQFLEKSEARRGPDPRNEKDIWIGTVAEMNSNKNLSAAIRAVAIYNKTANRKGYYTIIGSGELESEIAREGVRELGEICISHPLDARPHITAFDIFLLTSKKEGLPYVILEAGAAGLPVIASKVGGIPEIIEDGTSGILVEPSNVERFAAALQILAGDAELRERMGGALQKTVRELFSLSNMLEKTLTVYS